MSATATRIFDSRKQTPSVPARVAPATPTSAATTATNTAPAAPTNRNLLKQILAQLGEARTWFSNQEADNKTLSDTGEASAPADINWPLILGAGAAVLVAAWLANRH